MMWFSRKLADADAPTRAQRKGRHSPVSCWSLLLTTSNRIADKVKHVRHIIRTAVVPPEQRTIDQLHPGCSKRLPCPGRCLRFGDDPSACKRVECSTHGQDRKGLKFAGTQPLR